MDILHQIPTETKIKSELKKVLFGKTLFCPRCGSRHLKKYQGRHYCKRCRRPFTFTSITWLRGMKLSLSIFWLLLWCWENKLPVDQTRRVCGLSEPTVRNWYDKFREHLPQDKLSQIRLSGVIQMDEAYRGGKKKGYAIIGAKQKAEPNQQRKMVFQVVPKPSVDRSDAVNFLCQNVVPKSQLNTDGYSIYRGIDKWWPVQHQYERHNRWEFALTSEIEGEWGAYTTFVRRMYHHITREKVASVLQEFAARQMFPEWFRSPSSFLEVALQPISRIVRKPGKPRANFYQVKEPISSTNCLLNGLSLVPY